MRNEQQETKDLAFLLKEIERKVLGNQHEFNGSVKTIKDLRRIFDQDSSKMNRAIFNEAPSQEIFQETLRTISVLVEILSRTRT